MVHAAALLVLNVSVSTTKNMIYMSTVCTFVTLVQRYLKQKAKKEPVVHGYSNQTISY